jgi:hypothetical protein
MNADEDIQGREWNELYSKLVTFFRERGRESATGDGDFWVLDDNYSDRWFTQMVYLFSLNLLDVAIIAELRQMLQELPNWEIVLVVDIPEKEGEWPPMGLTIRRHEIIDGLSRDHLPEPYKSIVIPGSRPGTGYD